MHVPEALLRRRPSPCGPLCEGERNGISFRIQEEADAMFNSALIYELACLKVYAEPLLFGIDKNEPEYVEAKRLSEIL